jgi:hypothetical protein
VHAFSCFEAEPGCRPFSPLPFWGGAALLVALGVGDALDAKRAPGRVAARRARRALNVVLSPAPSLAPGGALGLSLSGRF